MGNGVVGRMLSDRERLRWAVRVRWLVIGGFLGLAAGARVAGTDVPLGLCVAAAAVGAGVNTVNAWSIRRGRWIGAVTVVAVTLDQVLITLVVIATGGAGSPFVTMYVVQVLATAMLVGTWAAAVSATFGMALWAVTTAVALSAGRVRGGGASAHPWPALVSRDEAVWAAYLLYCLGLLVYLGGYVAARLRRSEDDLAERNRSLAEALASLTVAHEALGASYDQLARAEAQLVQSEKMRGLGQLVAGVAHELNNPLSFVVANVEYLRAGVGRLEGALGAGDAVPLPPAVRAALDAVERQWRVRETVAELPGLVADCQEGARRAHEIVGELRAFARSNERDTIRAADLHAGLDSTVALLASRFAGHVTVHREYGTIPPVACWPEQLNQVFMNLLVNAADAIGDGVGNVWITTRAAPEGTDVRAAVMVAVRDDGGGIAPAALPRVFEPFFTTKAVGSGTGLGLSVSYGIARRHGGTITVESTPGRGATFTLWVPVQGPEAPAGTKRARVNAAPARDLRDLR